MSLKDYKYSNYEILHMKDSINCSTEWFPKLTFTMMVNRNVKYKNNVDSKDMLLYARLRSFD